MPPVTDGLVAWYRATAISGVANGGTVGTWPDSSGNGWHATQSNPASRPILRADALNGLPVVQFDGGDDRLSSATDLGLSGSDKPLTIVAVLRRRLGGASFAGWLGLTGPSGARMSTRTHPADGTNQAIRRDDVAVQVEGSTISGLAAESWGIYTTRFHGTTVDLLINGQGSSGLALDVGTLTLTTLFVGASGTDWNWFGDIAEILVYDRALSDTERAQVEGYLFGDYLAGEWSVIGDPGPKWVAEGPLSKWREALRTGAP